jgi:acyl-CoA synthetase (AMP-forming)/AMP-acid ligase II
MSSAPPPILFQGRCWSSPELADLALAWANALRDELAAATAPTAMVMANRPEAVALFFALSCFPAPLILLPSDAKEWQSAPPIPAGTRLVLPPGLRGLATEAERVGLAPRILPDPATSRGAPSARDPSRFLRSAGVVLFTSGSTQLPRPVYRRTAQVLAVARSLMATIGPPPGSGIISALPLARGFGFNHGLIAAAVLGSRLALLERFDPHALLQLFATGEHRYWAGTPMMADLLSRIPGPETHPAPPTCVAGGQVSPRLARQFQARFGVPLRQLYGTTEAASISVDARASADVQSDTAGRPLPGVDLRIGDDPHAPFAARTDGRIWIRAPEYLMEGYGFPPVLTPPETVDGWWPTPDCGHQDESGVLTVSGRLDDCFRTDAGRLVSPAVVAAALETLPGVTAVAAVPVGERESPTLGVLVESADGVQVADLRRHLASALPAWAPAQVVATTPVLPRLSNGKLDRRACIAILEEMISRG